MALIDNNPAPGKAHNFKDTTMKDKDIEELRNALHVLNQTLLELNHAQKNGPGWYTKGENGMYQQASMWLSRGFEALRKADKLMPEDYKIYS